MTTPTEKMRSIEAERTVAERFSRYLESRHLRKTPERFAILSRVVRLSGHFSGDALEVLMEKEGYHVSRSTIYNTLSLLCECGILVRHRFGTRAARYEMSMQNHCHLICQQCGSVTEVENPDFTGVLRSMNSGGFRPAYFSTSVYGLCSKCSQLTKQ